MSLPAADRLDILDVVTRADEAASRRDAGGYAALFTEDAVLDGSQGRHAGRAALRASVGPIWAAEGPATLHSCAAKRDSGGSPVAPCPTPGTVRERPGRGSQIWPPCTPASAGQTCLTLQLCLNAGDLGDVSQAGSLCLDFSLDRGSMSRTDYEERAR